ncbi:MAG: DUF1566 domain-containing protein [Cytophagales bacterium]|nr:DUF1566 domain-containing protein [Cytophagales bacterium]
METAQKRLFSVLLMLTLAGLSIAFCSCQKDDGTPDLNDGTVVLPDIDGYPIVGTGQITFYDNAAVIGQQAAGDDFYGQNANYPGNAPQYHDNSDGTVTDLVTGLMWAKTSDLNLDGEINVSDKKTYSEAVAGAQDFSVAGYSDWRLPTIKELYSLILFSGRDPMVEGNSAEGLKPFIDTDYFDFGYGDLNAGERIIDAQFASTNIYVDGEMMFGVNFADGRIKGYGLRRPNMPGEKTFYVLYVRGNSTYGLNNFADNGDGTVTDSSTGLMWMKEDSGEGVMWQEALRLAEGKEFAGYSDWRLPDVKELQSIVDYTRSPGTTQSAAIDPLFSCTPITNEAGERDYAFYWSSTTHVGDGEHRSGNSAAYVSFGRCMGNMNQWVDVHGAGAQRSDPKSGDPSLHEDGLGPQGDAIRIYNYVRLVRDAD